MTYTRDNINGLIFTIYRDNGTFTEEDYNYLVDTSDPMHVIKYWNGSKQLVVVGSIWEAEDVARRFNTGEWTVKLQKEVSYEVY